MRWYSGGVRSSQAASAVQIGLRSSTVCAAYMDCGEASGRVGRGAAAEARMGVPSVTGQRRCWHAADPTKLATLSCVVYTKHGRRDRAS